ncbi:hypothetical protein LCGC14_1170340, partial [marine sediment metagenome]
MARTGLGPVKNSIAFSLTLIIIFIFIIGQGSLWLWFLFTQKDMYGDMLHDRAKMAARMLSATAQEYVIKGDLPSLEKAVSRIAEDKIIISVKVFDADGTMLAGASTGIEESAALNPLYVPWKSEVRSPIMKGSQQVGEVEVFYSGREANNAMFWLLSTPPVAQGFVFLVIVALIYIFTYLKIGKPIGILSDRLERITSGDLTVGIPEMDENELGAIADGLRYLVQRFSATVRRMNSLASNVIETIVGISSSFENSMEMVKKQSISTDEIALTVKNSLDSQKKISENTEQLTGISSENVSALMEVKASEDEIVGHMGSLYGATEKSYSIVSEMVDTTAKVNENVQQVLTSVENTSASVEEIIASVKE